MWGVIGFLLAISVLVVVHECGHYWAARLCGVRVLSYSFGFGPVLAKRRDKRGCEWRLSAVPMGGYVVMLEEGTRGRVPQISDDEFRRTSFDHKSVWARLAIVAAGPVMNFVFAALCYSLIAMVGTYEASSRLDTPAAATQLAAQGVERGWKVEAIDGKKIATFGAITYSLVEHLGEENVSVTLSDEEGLRHEVRVSLAGLTKLEQQAPDAALGFRPWSGQVVVGRVVPDSPAARAGLAAGEAVLAVNDAPVTSVADLVEDIALRPGVAMRFVVKNLQTGAERTVTVTPDNAPDPAGGKARGKIGVMLAATPDYVYTRLNPVAALGHGVVRTWEMTVFTAASFKKILTGAADIENISGPITIGDLAGKMLQVNWVTFVLFMALLSVNLGLLNLLPVPVLDGGHIVFFLWEAATGTKANERVVAVGTKIGLCLILLLAAVALTNDLTRILG